MYYELAQKDLDWITQEKDGNAFLINLIDSPGQLSGSLKSRLYWLPCPPNSGKAFTIFLPH